MKAFNLPLVLALAVAGCDSGKPVEAASTDCKAIVSALERLACFDQAAGTPPLPVEALRQPGHPPAVVEPEIIGLLKENEADREPSQAGVKLLRAPDTLPGQKRIAITAPSTRGIATEPYLAISCLANISRLQLISRAPVDVNRMNIRLLLDNRPLGDARPWQVLEDGKIVDAGRGLVAIEQLRQMSQPASQIWVESDYAPFDGVRFDVSGLHAQILAQREACHW
ncbi:type VI secretion system-associated protein TagO [Pseudomonas aeruginosa]|uniref:type VI secretion system-associated protein TagO n=1 Tax=Pseudomonas aeruginosa TaxID=287 RepID=UPI0015C5237F|nr:type VI secretion system-associated protein TagO [Pseudomonas aeruginosa]MDG3821081.1 type VI secretion protein [Pseudomonas aeruginosa]NPW37880.1 type VI secretion system-associated protein TagO [Pseudomonas aeruginosa]